MRQGGDDSAALVLVADDEPFNLRLLEELCAGAGYRVATAENGRQVLESIARERPDLVLLDIGMPDLDGYEVMQILKKDPDLAAIPIIVVTGRGDDEGRSRAIGLGAEDWVSKPYRVFEVQQRIRNALRVRAAEDAAARAARRVQSSEVVDPLTRAGTSKQLVITLDYETVRATRYGHPLTCVVVRFVNFESVLARGGPDGADAALVSIAGGLRSCIRSVDHMFRSEVDEFTLVLPETGPDGAQVVLSRVREGAVDSSLWGVAMRPAPALSIGVSTLGGDVTDGDALREAALAAIGR
jgi:diguanylate cyclase (GGDEF)-like protein